MPDALYTWPSPKPRIGKGGAALILGLMLTLPACDTFRYDPGNSLEGRALKAGMRTYANKNAARKPEASLPTLPTEASTASTTDLGVAAPYITCDTFAECLGMAQGLDRRIGWTNADFPVGYGGELYQLRQVANRALGFEDSDPRCHEYRAKAREGLQDWAGALEDWSAVLAKLPNDVQALIRRAHMETVGGAPQKGLADVQRALDIEPGNIAALLERATIRERLQENDAALADLDQVLARQPGNVTALSERATVHTRLHEHAPALADMDRAIALQPRNTDLYAQRGNVHETFEEPDLARADYQQACDLGDPFWCTIARR